MRIRHVNAPSQAEQIDLESIAQGLSTLRNHLSQLADIDSSYEEDREEIEAGEVDALMVRNNDAIDACIDAGIDPDGISTTFATTGGPDASKSANKSLGVLYETTEQEKAALESTIVRILEDFEELVQSIDLEDENVDLKKVCRFLRYILGYSENPPREIDKKIRDYVEETGEDDEVTAVLESFLLLLDA